MVISGSMVRISRPDVVQACPPLGGGLPIGAAHLIGPDSVIAMLAAKGVVAERVQ